MKKILLKENSVFEIDKNTITHQLNFYLLENQKLKKFFNF